MQLKSNQEKEVKISETKFFNESGILTEKNLMWLNINKFQNFKEVNAFYKLKNISKLVQEVKFKIN